MRDIGLALGFASGLLVFCGFDYVTSRWLSRRLRGALTWATLLALAVLVIDHTLLSR